MIGDDDWSRYHSKQSGKSSTSENIEETEILKKKEEAKLQEEMDFMKTLDLKFQEKDAIMELSVCDTIRTYMECQGGQNPVVLNSIKFFT